MGLGMLFGQGKRRREAGALYAQIVAQARQPEFYAALRVPDTIEGRLELVTLHCHAVMRRLRFLGPQAAPAAQDLLQYMFDDLDRSIREVGVGDVSIGKYMKRLGKNFYGRAEAYDRALDAVDRDALAEALNRNVLATGEAGEAQKAEAALLLADYVFALHKTLEGDDLAALNGTIRFPAIERQIA